MQTGLQKYRRAQDHSMEPISETPLKLDGVLYKTHSDSPLHILLAC